MKNRPHLAFTFFLPTLSLLLGCATESASSKAQLNGTLNYREKVALPPKATATVALRDDRTSSPYEAIAVSVVENPAAGPIAFTVTYDPRKIRPQGIYHLDATISFAGKSRFALHDFKVLTQGGPTDHVELWLDAVK